MTPVIELCDLPRTGSREFGQLPPEFDDEERFHPVAMLVLATPDPLRTDLSFAEELRIAFSAEYGSDPWIVTTSPAELPPPQLEQWINERTSTGLGFPVVFVSLNNPPDVVLPYARVLQEAQRDTQLVILSPESLDFQGWLSLHGVPHTVRQTPDFRTPESRTKTIGSPEYWFFKNLETSMGSAMGEPS